MRETVAYGPLFGKKGSYHFLGPIFPPGTFRVPSCDQDVSSWFQVWLSSQPSQALAGKMGFTWIGCSSEFPDATLVNCLSLYGK